MACDVIVIGGGPSGLMAAIAAARGGARTLLRQKLPERAVPLMLRLTGA